MTVSSVRLKPSNFYTFLIAIFLCVCAYKSGVSFREEACGRCVLRINGSIGYCLHAFLHLHYVFG
ncbi:hypothetical protein EZS27_015517 [termite gut metagenome]|uniref:Uncharacterized protein n=1 Tax=termite gut metagenome TaxID=433724 RepID=A0A5J4RSM3_9ZZZZ